MYDSLKEKQVDDDIAELEKKKTSCCKAEQGLHNGKWICFCCGMPYDAIMKRKK